jgi:hypothetical protein
MAHNPSHPPEPDDEFEMPGGAGWTDAAAGSRQPLAAPRLLAIARRSTAARRARERVFESGICANPPWKILLDLFIAGEEGRNVTIKSACVAAGVPQSTALRHIAHLIDIGLTVRSQHPSDARSAFLRLSDSGRAKMIDYLGQAADGPDGFDG